MKLSACIELLFADEAEDPAERIRLTRGSGLDAVEFWRWTGKDLDAVAAALDETGLPLAAMVAEPMVPLTDPAAHDEFLEGLARSAEVARRLGAPVLIAQTGDDLDGRSRAEQHAAIVAVLRRAARILEGTGVTLAIEPLNSPIDHPRYYLVSTVEGLDIIDEVGRPEIRILYDIYHSAVMDEPVTVLDGRVDRVAHLHLADHPGRGSRAAARWTSRTGSAGSVRPATMAISASNTGRRGRPPRRCASPRASDPVRVPRLAASRESASDRSDRQGHALGPGLSRSEAAQPVAPHVCRSAQMALRLEREAIEVGCRE